MKRIGPRLSTVDLVPIPPQQSVIIKLERGGDGLSDEVKNSGEVDFSSAGACRVPPVCAVGSCHSFRAIARY
jgi:hypothetical protein